MAEIEINKGNNETKDTADQKNNFSQSGTTGSQAGKSENDISGKVVDAVSGDTKAAKDVLNKAKESTSDIAAKVYDTATEKASTLIDQQKSSLAEGLSSVAENILQLGSNLRGADQANGITNATADYVNTAADKVEQISKYLNKKDMKEMMRDAEDFAHRNPALFLGGAFVLGLLAARFLKSSSPNRSSSRSFSNTQRSNSEIDNTEGVHLPENLDELSRAAEARKNSTTNTASDTGENKSANAATSNKR